MRFAFERKSELMDDRKGRRDGEWLAGTPDFMYFAENSHTHSAAFRQTVEIGGSKKGCVNHPSSPRTG